MYFAVGSRICYSTDPPAEAIVWANPILESLSLSINDQEQKKKKVQSYSSVLKRISIGAHLIHRTREKCSY